MTTGHDSLAAQLATTFLGPVTGDPFRDAIRTAILSGAARLGELDQTGFDTSTPFDSVNQAKYVSEDRIPFLLVSLGTNTTYFVMSILLFVYFVMLTLSMRYSAFPIHPKKYFAKGPADSP